MNLIESCTLDDETIPHGLTYRDECSSWLVILL